MLLRIEVMIFCGTLLINNTIIASWYEDNHYWLDVQQTVPIAWLHAIMVCMEGK